MENIGYCRVSTKDQNLDRQIKLLMSNGCTEDHLYIEKVSGKNKDRIELNKMLSFIRKGDTLHVESISRLARSTRDLLSIVDTLKEKGVELKIYKESIDTSSPTGKFVLTVFAALAEMDRESMLERQKEGIEAARARGVHMGRPALVKPDNWEDVYSEWKAGEITAVKAIKDLGISKASFYRLVKGAVE